jgi:hypothetical protein
MERAKRQICNTKGQIYIESITMSLLINLPEELLSQELSVWLTIVDVARLDSATCCLAARKAFVQAAFNRRTLLSYPPSVNIKTMKLCDAINGWIFKRSALVSGFYATPVFLRSHEKREQYLRQHGDAIQWVEYTCRANCDDYETSALDIARYCSNLIRFHGENCQDERVFIQIA